MVLARPHKFLDAAKLEEWAQEHAPHTFSEWSGGDWVAWVDYWDWLGEEYPDVLDEFEDWFRENGKEMAI